MARETTDIRRAVVDEHGSMPGVPSGQGCTRMALNAGYRKERGVQVDGYMSKTADTADRGAGIVQRAEHFIAEKDR